jgi:hypothetical protein
MEIFDAEHQGRARIELKLPVDAASCCPAEHCGAA